MAFHGKVALVTGGGSGMGQEAAWQLAAGGALVAIADMNEEGMAQTRAKYADRIHCYPLNVCDANAVADLVVRVEQECGPIDRLTHAAGIMPTGLLAAVSAAAITQAMAVNFNGTVNLVSAVLPGMLARDSGDIIVFGSMAGDVLTNHLGAYCASKAAVNAYGEILSHELEKTRLRILLVCPPMVNTPLVEQGEENRPPSVQYALDRRDSQMLTPSYMINAIEAGIEKGARILRPGNAKIMVWLRRHCPWLVWKIVKLANKG
jgi:NADP-dependent 3-hydroxy acid dehydrogenase YdfG